jgi:hypothetical protein
MAGNKEGDGKGGKGNDHKNESGGQRRGQVQGRQGRWQQRQGCWVRDSNSNKEGNGNSNKGGEQEIGQWQQRG